ncbi:hypothetical protein SESBI_18833 [Sesbania bispinosa]|nr:hypothetical protein SESBI_18833 [Sesbania bispinosa]
MGKKIKHEKLGSTRSQESSNNEPPNKEDEAQPNVTLGPNTKTRTVICTIESGAADTTLPHPQQGQVFAQSPLPFWLPQPPAAAGPLLGPYLPPIFQAFNGTGWQGHPVVPEGTSSTTQTLVPNVCYQLGYIFPGFPG